MAISPVICSRYRVTLNPLSTSPRVILEYDDSLAAEPLFNQGRLVEVAQYVPPSSGRLYSRPRARKNYSHTLSFSRVVEVQDIAAAGRAIFERGSLEPDNPFEVLIEVQNESGPDTGFLLLDAVVQELPGELTDATEVLEVWEIIAGRKEDLGTAGIAGIAWEDDTGDEITDDAGEIIYFT